MRLSSMSEPGVICMDGNSGAALETRLFGTNVTLEYDDVMLCPDRPGDLAPHGKET